MDRKKDKIKNHYTKCLEQMITDLDFKRYFSEDVKILKYSELSGYSNIYELLPSKKDFCIILTEEEKNTGHWCCLVRNGDLITWFDSYGIKPDGELKFIPYTVRKMLGEDKHHLSRLLETAKKYIWNKKKFQKLRDGVNTCGRWVIAFILMSQLGYSLNDFIKKVEEKTEETEKPNDILICDWIK